MDTTGYCTFCGVSPDISGRCGCHVLQSSRRVARIRELAERILVAASSGTPIDTSLDANEYRDGFRQAAGIVWIAALEFITELDRLEAEERAKEAEK